MSGPIRQSNLFSAEDFLKVYRAFRDVNFTAYDFDTIRSALVTYIQKQYPEDFNDYIESSEFIAIVELLAYLGTSISLRTDLNSRENFLDTADRRESIIRLARMLSYNPKRNIAASGLFKITAIETNEVVTDSLGRELNGTTIFWNDSNNPDSFEQFITVMNAAFDSINPFGQPTKNAVLLDIPTELYQVNSVLPRDPVNNISLTIPAGSIPWDVVNPDIESDSYITERHPDPNEAFNLIYRNDGLGAESSNTGFFMYLIQGKLTTEDFRIDYPKKNRVLDVEGTGINQTDVYFQEINDNGTIIQKWTRVPALSGNNVIFNSTELDVRDIYNVISENDDSIKLKFADGNFGNVPRGLYRAWYRKSFGKYFTLSPDDASNLQMSIPYTSKTGENYTLTVYFGLEDSIANSTPAETNEQIKLNAPALFYTQDRMVNSEDYNVFPLSRGNEVEKVRAINRTHAGHSRFIDINDPTGIFQNVKLYAEDGALYRDYEPERFQIDVDSASDFTTIIAEDVFTFLSNQRLNNFFYGDVYNQFNNQSIADSSDGISVLDYEGLNYRWSALPQKFQGETGFISNKDDAAADDIFIYASGAWDNGTVSSDHSVGIPIDPSTRFTVEAVVGVTEGDYYVEDNLIKFYDSYAPANLDQVTIHYRIPVNMNLGSNIYIDAGSKAVFFDPVLPTDTKTVTIKGIINAGLPASESVSNIGPIELSTFVEDTWQLKSVLPKFRISFTETEIADIRDQMELSNDFGLGYDIESDTWYIIPANKILLGDLDINNYDAASADSSLDASWLVYVNFVSAVDSSASDQYEFTSRGMKYLFESLDEVRFFYSPEQRVIDIETGKEKQDEILLHETNTKAEEIVTEVWYYNVGFDAWEDAQPNWTVRYPHEVGIPLIINDPREQTITGSNGQDISNEDIDERGVLITDKPGVDWYQGSAITIQYNKFAGFLEEPLRWNIYRSFLLEDGYLDQTTVEIRPVDSDEDGVPDYPLSFDTFVNAEDIIFFEGYTNYDGYRYFRPWITGYHTVSAVSAANMDFGNEEYDGFNITATGLYTYGSLSDIQSFISYLESPDNYLLIGETTGNTSETTRIARQRDYAQLWENKVIYNSVTDIFYKLPLIVPPAPPEKPELAYNWGRTKVDFDHYSRNGRTLTLNTYEDDQEALPFNWKHYAPIENRIDPSVSNIIDMYLLTATYYNSIIVWKEENLPLVDMPVAPSTDELRLQFGEFDQYKMLSDQIIYNPATFKILFGSQAATELRATFKVVKITSSFVSDSEVKSRVIQAIDTYFDISNWDFGESFYYTELAAYIHIQLSSIISSVVIVPSKSESQFGDLFQIKAESTELFLSTATVQNVEIVQSLTEINLRTK